MVDVDVCIQTGIFRVVPSFLFYCNSLLLVQYPDLPAKKL